MSETATLTAIRAATAADVDAIVAMGLEFQRTTSYAQHLRATAETLRALALQLVAAAGNAAIFLAEKDERIIGMIAVGLYTQPMSGERVGSEICWWMDPRARGGRTAIRLLRAAEEWAQQHGAVVFQMMAPSTAPALGAFYEALDYDPIETHYMRRLGGD